MKKKIFIIGSINTDLAIQTPKMPQKGETITGSGFFIAHGGKGANQAVAAARLGGDVMMCGCVGEDDFGASAIAALQTDGVDTRYIRKVDAPTGTAMIILSEGDNRIILDKGANACLTEKDIDEVLKEAHEGDIYLTQLENPIDVIGYGLQKAQEKGMYVILNPAPAALECKPFLKYCMVAHQGKGINPIRQDMSHTHQVFFSLDQKYVLCCDLGLDTLFCYDRALHLVSSAKVADGYGIRHAVFSKDGKYIYALSEMVPAVHVFSFNEGKVSFLKKYDISCEKEKADGAAIRLSKDGKKLYTSLRIENALVTFDVNGVALQFQQKIDCGGDSPRDFWVTDDYLIVTNEKSNNVVIYPIQNGSLVPEKVADISVVAPLCCIVNM